MTTTLVLGGPRSGAADHAQALLRGSRAVTYVDASAHPLESGVSARPLESGVSLHHGDHPDGWVVVRSHDLTRALLGSRHPVVVDDVVGWIRNQLDDGGLWDDPDGARALVDRLAEEFALAAQALSFDVVVLSQEPTLFSRSDHRHQLLLMELLADVNRRLSSASARVHVIVSGRLLDLSEARVVL